jgi:hypothetical protein
MYQSALLSPSAFSCLKYTSKKYALIPKLTQPHPVGTPAHRIFSFLDPKNTNRSFYFPIGKSTPTNLFTRFPLLFTYREIGTRDFANPKVSGWLLILRVPKRRYKSALTFPFSYRDFLYQDLGTRGVEQLSSPIPESRYAETLMSLRSFEFSKVPSPRRDFGLHGITNHDVECLGLLAAKPRWLVPPVLHSPTPLWPTHCPSTVRILRITISRFLLQ